MPEEEGKHDESESKHSDADSDGEADAPDADALLRACESLEDLLLDDIMPADLFLGEDVPGESKGEEFPLFKQIQACCRDALPDFVEAVEQGLDVSEYALRHTEWHVKFLSIRL